jgi:hypothetical protein
VFASPAPRSNAVSVPTEIWVLAPLPVRNPGWLRQAGVAFLFSLVMAAPSFGGAVPSRIGVDVRGARSDYRDSAVLEKAFRMPTAPDISVAEPPINDGIGVFCGDFNQPRRSAPYTGLYNVSKEIPFIDGRLRESIDLRELAKSDAVFKKFSGRLP